MLKNNLIDVRHISHDTKVSPNNLSSTDGFMETVNDKSRERGWQSSGLSGILVGQIEEIDMTGFPEFSKQGEELLTELQLYLGFPGSGRLNSLLNRVKNLEAGFSEMTPSQIGRNQVDEQK